MKYEPRPGIVLTSVCGVKLLVPDRKASEFCPYVIRLPFLYAAEWSALASGKTQEDLYHIHSILTKETEEESRVKVDGFLRELCEKGFLIAEEEEE